MYFGKTNEFDLVKHTKLTVFNYALGVLKENQGDVSRSAGNGASEVPTTNSDAGESSLHRRRRRTRRSVTNPLTTIITEPAVLLSDAEQFPTVCLCLF